MSGHGEATRALAEDDLIFLLDGEFDRGDNRAHPFNRSKCSLNL